MNIYGVDPGSYNLKDINHPISEQLAGEGKHDEDVQKRPLKDLLKESKTEGLPQLLSMDEIRELEAVLADKEQSKKFFEKKENKGLDLVLRRCQEGVSYANIAKLPTKLKQLIGAEEILKFEMIAGDMDLGNGEVKKYLQKNMDNPAFRMGISQGCNMKGQVGIKFRKVENYINQHMMVKTLKTNSKEEYLKSIKEEKMDMTESELSKEAEKRKVTNDKAVLTMARSMYMCHLGRTTFNYGGQDLDYHGSISELFVHGGRIRMDLPSVPNETEGKEQAKIVAGTDNMTQGRYATHTLNKKAVDKDAKGNETKKTDNQKSSYEGKPVFATHSDNYYVNLAVGGDLNETGGSTLTRTIKNNGEYGHLYYRVLPGDKNTHGAIMVGIETSAPGKKTYTGHAHGISAKKADINAFMCDKRTVGADMNARHVDLTGVNKLEQKMQRFDEFYTALLASDNADLIEKINSLLTGSKMKGMDEKTHTETSAMEDIVNEYFDNGKKIEALKDYHIISVMCKDADEFKVRSADIQVCQADANWVDLARNLSNAEVGRTKLTTRLRRLGGHKDSAKMVAVKNALQAAIMTQNQEPQSAYEQAIDELVIACDAYTSDSSKDKENKRYKTVAKIQIHAKTEQLSLSLSKPAMEDDMDFMDVQRNSSMEEQKEFAPSLLDSTKQKQMNLNSMN